MSKLVIEANSIALSFFASEASREGSAPKAISNILEWLDNIKSLNPDHEIILVTEDKDLLLNNPDPAINSFVQVMFLWASQYGISTYNTVSNRAIDAAYSIALEQPGSIIASTDPRTASLLSDELSLLKPPSEKKYTRSELFAETQGLKPSDVPIFLSLIGAPSFGMEAIAGIQNSLEIAKIANGDVDTVFLEAKSRNGFDYTRIVNSADKFRKNLGHAKIKEVQITENNFSSHSDATAKSKIDGFLKNNAIRNRSSKELPDYPVDYRLINNETEFAWLKTIFSKAKAYAINFERDENGIFAASISFKEGNTIIVPLNDAFGQTIDEFEVRSILKDLIESNKNIVTFSAIQTSRDMIELGIKSFTIKAEISSAAYLINTRDIINDISELNDESAKMIPSMHDFCVREGGGRAANTDHFKLFKLCAIRSDITWRNSKVYFNQILSEGLKDQYQKYEIPQSQICAKMGQDGIVIDIPGLKAYRKSVTEKQGKHLQAIKKLYGKDTDVTSPTEVSAILDHFGLTTGETSTGKRAINEIELKAIEAQHPVIAHLIKARSLSTVLSKQVDKILNAVDGDGVLRFNVFTNSTLTSRLSIRNPDLQNSTAEMRGFMKAREGYKFVSFDYSQIEMRILASASKEKRLINAFINGGDVHRETAAEVFQTPPEKVTEDQRKAAKAINFGLIYGMSPMGLSVKLGISVQKASSYIQMYFDRLPGVKRFHEELLSSVRKNGFIELVSGRKITFPDINSNNSSERNGQERSCKNAPMQGTGAEIVKRGMIKTDQLINDQNYDARIALQVHDELVFEVKSEIAAEFATKAKYELENALDIGVPLTVDMFIGQNLNKKPSNTNELSSSLALTC